MADGWREYFHACLQDFKNDFNQTWIMKKTGDFIISNISDYFQQIQIIFALGCHKYNVIRRCCQAHMLAYIGCNISDVALGTIHTL